MVGAARFIDFRAGPGPVPAMYMVVIDTKENPMKKRAKDPRTAAQAYEDKFKAIQTLLETLSIQLTDHKAKMEAEPKNWGFIGDLEEIHQRMATAVSFLAQDEE
jgi:hypothetical protein